MRSPKVRALNMTTRYDYSSISDQGYLTGPPNMQVESWLQLWPLKWVVLVSNHGKFSKNPEEEIAMTTLDVMIHSYLPFDTIDLLKLDVEGQVVFNHRSLCVDALHEKFLHTCFVSWLDI